MELTELWIKDSHATIRGGGKAVNGKAVNVKAVGKPSCMVLVDRAVYYPREEIHKRVLVTAKSFLDESRIRGYELSFDAYSLGEHTRVFGEQKDDEFKEKVIPIQFYKII